MNAPASMRGGKASAYGGYLQREVPAENAEITRTGPGTPLGEYLRRFWQPVCLSSQLTDVAHPIRIMGEDLVAFRDRSGSVGVLARHCCHRGASLEYGIIQRHGIRCCYHGFHFDVDGCLLDVPIEQDRGARLRETIAQGAYPALERDGLVFAYMGPPSNRPPFEEWDSFDKSGDTKLVPFSNVFPCNWLQVLDNIADQMHTATLHQPASLFDGPLPENLDFEPFTLGAFGTVPVLDYVPVRSGTAMAFVAGRRTSDALVWWRINECALPNMTHHAYLFEDGKTRRPFHRVHMCRWYVPVDDTHSIIYGWRMFGLEIDPYQKGREDRVGWDDMDFLEGQVGNRDYHEQQRLPGDWEAIVSQRPIAIHALEHPTSADVGVYMYRRLLRDALRRRNPAAGPENLHARLDANMPLHTYTQNTVLNIPVQPTPDADKAMIRDIGRKLIQITSEADGLLGTERLQFVRSCYSELENSLR